jgi:hypothetical protein
MAARSGQLGVSMHVGRQPREMLPEIHAAIGLNDTDSDVSCNVSPDAHASDVVT